MANTIGARIRNARTYAGLTQEELGQKVGKTKATINKYETGIVLNLKRPIVEAIAQALNISPGSLMGWDDAIPVFDDRSETSTINSLKALQEYMKSQTFIKSTLNKEEAELIRIYRDLRVKGRMVLLTKAIDLEKEEENL